MLCWSTAREAALTIQLRANTLHWFVIGFETVPPGIRQHRHVHNMDLSDGTLGSTLCPYQCNYHAGC